MTRILAKDGNVIAADFGARQDITIKVVSEILYVDERVMLTRSAVTLNGNPSGMPPIHFMADLTTGHIVHL